MPSTIDSLSAREVADIHYIYGFCDGNARAASREYRQRFPTRPAVDYRVFLAVHRELNENGLYRPHRERAPTVPLDVDEHVSLTKRPLNLNDIVDALHNIDSDDDLPSEITIFPPEDPNNEITDEDSGSQLRAPAEITYDDTFSDSDDSENDLSLSVLAKRIRNANECLPEHLDQQISSTSCSTPSISCSSRNVTLIVSKTQQYTWRNRHNSSEFTQ
ncbi:unnamed protein product [Parnassius apollo]|uniref:(apollo) hypothetical protein n=1 Tax=Parnassius apollo TaxID=110799 RepID=A0A8S3X126_PARAO|nr:unnamed protein product [Parnassius apollo]